MKLVVVIAVLTLISTYGYSQTPEDSVGLQYPVRTWKQRWMIPVPHETVLSGAPMAATDSIFRVSVDLRFVNSPTVSFQFPVLNKETYEYYDTTITVSMPDTGRYGVWSVPLLSGDRFITVICVPVGYPNYTSTGYGIADSLRDALGLLRWGITTISFTDSNFWKFHESEIRKLDSLIGTPQASLFERATKMVAADQIDMEPGSIFVSYNNSTRVLTYLRRKL